MSITYRPPCRCKGLHHEPSCAYFDPGVDPAGPGPYRRSAPRKRRLRADVVDTEQSYQRALRGKHKHAVIPTFLEPEALPFEADSPADPDRSWAWRDSGE